MSKSDLREVRRNGLMLKYIKEQTNEICLEAIKQNSHALLYVKKQTNEICLEAVKQDSAALLYVKKQTEEICLEAVKRNGHTLYYVKKQTEEICLEAVKQNGLALIYVKEQTNEICLEAIKQNVVALSCVRKQTKEICLEAVKMNIEALSCAKKTKGIYLDEVKLNESVLMYVNIKYTKFIYKYLKSINFKNLENNCEFIMSKDLNDFKKYYECDKYLNGWGIKYLKQNLSLCKLVMNDYKFLSFVNYKKPKLCLQIIKTFKKGFQYINKQYIEILL